MKNIDEIQKKHGENLQKTFGNSVKTRNTKLPT